MARSDERRCFRRKGRRVPEGKAEGRVPMKRYVTILVLSGASFLSPLHAQFNLNKLNEGLSGLNNAARAAKEVGKVAKSAAGIGPEEERVIGGSVAVEIVGT